MEILERTSTKLTLRHRPVGLWLIAGSLVLVVPCLLLLLGSTNRWLFYIPWFPFLPILCILTGLFLFIFVSQVVICNFDKKADRVSLKRRRFLKTVFIENSLQDIIDIQLESTSWQNTERTNYQIIIFLKRGQVMPLHLWQNSDEKEKQSAVNIIRNFLNSSS